MINLTELMVISIKLYYRTASLYRESLRINDQIDETMIERFCSKKGKIEDIDDRKQGT